MIAEAAELAQEGVACFLAIETAPTEDIQRDWRAEQGAYQEAAARKIAGYGWWRTCGLYALAVALTAFIVASATGGFWFWNKLAPDSPAAPLYSMSFPSEWMDRIGASREIVP